VCRNESSRSVRGNRAERNDPSGPPGKGCTRKWFFNEAEIAIDQPSNFQGLLGGCSPTSLEQVERRAEAMHAARKIKERLERLRSTDALLLAGLYTERPWSRAVTRALPGGLAGAARVSVPVGAAYAHALTHATTGAKDVDAFVEEIVCKGSAELIASWREQLKVACAIAMREYERVRRDGPSVVPEEDG
jgi:hypothetical protein